jgi:glutathione S-transferase
MMLLLGDGAGSFKLPWRPWRCPGMVRDGARRWQQKEPIMIAMPATLMSAIVTVLIVLTYFYTSIPVSRMRGKHGIKAPAIGGHPEFERAFRVHMNTLEQMPIILPLLWLATLFFHTIGWLPAVFGLLWIIGRIVYMVAYMNDPAKRETGFGITIVADLALLILAIMGIANSWIAVTAV